MSILETTPHVFTHGTSVYRRGSNVASRFATGDLDRLYAGSGDWLQLTPGNFTCSRARASVDGMRITELDISCGVQIRNDVEPWRTIILLLRPGDGCQILANGKKYTDPCCVIASGTELAVNVLGAATIHWFDVERRMLSETDRAFPPVRHTFAPGAMHAWTLATYAADRLAGARVADSEVKRIMSTMLQRGRGRAESTADSNREKLVRTALDLMWASIEEPPTLREICAAARCSVRTLIYVFNATFGMSPMKYFKIQRLNVAHRRLQSAESGARVFDIAADCGFWHLGHFGVDYKAFFGTTPRTTPRQQARLNIA